MMESWQATWIVVCLVTIRRTDPKDDWFFVLLAIVYWHALRVVHIFVTYLLANA